MSSPADYTVEIELPAHKRGDEWIGIALIGPVIVNGSTPAETLARVVMTLERIAPAVVNGVPVEPDRFILDSVAGDAVDAPIVIDNATTWQARIPAVPDFVQKAGDWKWDISFYRTDKTSPQTFYKGTLHVYDDV